MFMQDAVYITVSIFLLYRSTLQGLKCDNKGSYCEFLSTAVFEKHHIEDECLQHDKNKLAISAAKLYYQSILWAEIAKEMKLSPFGFATLAAC